MELISEPAIVGSFVLGAALGIITLITCNERTKLIVDAAGGIALFGVLFAILPTVASGTPAYEAFQNIFVFIVTALQAVLTYIIGDAIGSGAYWMVSQFRI